MLDEGVVQAVQDIDLCMLLGAGWPFWLGGISAYLDRAGVSEAVTGKRFLPRGRGLAPRLSVRRRPTARGPLVVEGPGPSPVPQPARIEPVSRSDFRSLRIQAQPPPPPPPWSS